MRVLVVLAMLLIPLAATAVHHDTANIVLYDTADVMLDDILLAQRGPSSLLPNQDGARISSKQAASRVKQRYQDSKILSINLIQSKGPAVYRVKTLSASGVVKYVFVDGTTGDVFE